VVVVPPFPLENVKKIKHAAKVTVNDVLMAAMAGAIRRFCLANDDPAFKTNNASVENGGADQVRLRALLPIAFPRSNAALGDPATALTNKWAFLSAQLPAALPTVEQRLAYTRAATAAMKAGLDGPVTMHLGNLLNAALPRALSRKTVGDLFQRHSLVFSNVPGPSVPVFLAGKRVAGVQMVYPNLLPQVGVLSYAGQVFMNVTADCVTLDKGHDLAKHVLDELRAMATAFKVEWEESAENKQ
jgi:hypothetical protein